MYKMLFFLLFLTIAFTSANAQINISTTLRSDFVWNSKTEEWVWVSDDEDEKTFFEINKALTIMKHTTPSITSTYRIKNSQEDKMNKLWEFKVISDVGNDYVMLLDIKNDNVRFIGKANGKLFLVRHTIKRIWFDE